MAEAPHDREHYLWDPTAPSDPEIAALENMLRPHSADARGLLHRELPLSSPSRRSWRYVAFAAAAGIAALVMLLQYRLSWPRNEPWPVFITQSRQIRSQSLNVGDSIVTRPGETAVIRTARIGRIVLQEGSALQLRGTETGRHRVELVYGRLHAKVWAPPKFFAVTTRDWSFVDLGCEFTIDVDSSGRGVLNVHSGWVAHLDDDRDVLVPEGYALQFDSTRIATPLSVNASDELRRLISSLETELQQEQLDMFDIQQLSAAIAAASTDADAFSLLSLLVRHPHLAQTDLYTRVARTEIGPGNDAHRARWARGDLQAMNEWSGRLPKPPKTWWRNWRDAF